MTELQELEPQVVKRSFLSKQVCVPGTWTDEQIIEFATQDGPSGTEKGWTIRRQGDPALIGCPERNPCENNLAKVHVMLDA